MSLSNAMGATGDLPKEIVICRDREDLGDQAARSFVRSAQEAVSLRGRFSVALSGGATLRTFYRSLTSAAFAEKIPWKSVHLFWGDERAVPPDHPDSNYHLAEEALISHVPIPSENIHRMPGERRDLRAAGKEKAAIVRAVLSENPSSTDLPARMVRPRNGERLFFLDREAAGFLGKDLR